MTISSDHAILWKALLTKSLNQEPGADVQS